LIFSRDQIPIDILLTDWRDNLKIRRQQALQHLAVLQVETTDDSADHYYKVKLN
jgi:hypothetical protein